MIAMSDNYNANIYLKTEDLNDIEDKIEELTEECHERIYDKNDTTYSGTSFQAKANPIEHSELTEMDGQTTQEGTPTPSTPQPINITTGLQNVSICGKNLFDINGQTTGTSLPEIINNGFKLTKGTNRFCRFVLPNECEAGTYTISYDLINYNLSGSGNLFSCTLQYGSGNTAIQTIVLNNSTSLTFTTTQAFDRLYFFIASSQADTATITIDNVQLEKGTATPYEEYKCTDYEINLGTNLLNTNLEMIKSINTGGTWNNNVYTLNGVDFTYNDDGSVTATGTASANINFYFSRSGNYAHTTLPSGTYYFTSHEETGSNSTWKTQISINGTGYNVFGNGTSKEVSKTLTEDTPVYIYIVIYSGKNPNGATFYPMVSKSSGIQWYPYKTPIELCKIGDYQDRIFKNTIDSPLYDSNLEEGQWYIHKEIGKVVLTGASSESWSNQTAQNLTNTLYLRTPILDGLCKNDIPTLFFSNYFKPVEVLWNNDEEGIQLTTNTPNIRLRINKTTTSSTDNFKTWLSTHNLELYYVLATPTNTLIEDEELINELESVSLLTGLNNVLVSSTDLQGIISMYVYMSNALRNIKVGDNLGGKTLYLSLPRTSYENISTDDTDNHYFISTNTDHSICHKHYSNGTKIIGFRYKNRDSVTSYLIKFFYACYSTGINPYLNIVRFRLPKNVGTVTSIDTTNPFYQYIKIFDESAIPDYEKHIWSVNEPLTMQKIDHIANGIENIGFYYEKPNGWVNEKEWLGIGKLNGITNYGVGIKTISYQDFNRWYNNLDLITFDDLNEITLWNNFKDISQIEWNDESNEEWIDNFNLVLYNLTTEDSNTLITESNDTLSILINEMT